jgi:hypothetical protein
MRCKLDKLRDAAAAGDWAGALRIAARFPRLGEHATAITRAHQAMWNPAWSRQLGRDPAADVEAGIEALRERYRLGPIEAQRPK